MSMGYDTMTDAELDAEIVELRAAARSLTSGGDVQVVAGEGRRMEYTRANHQDLRRDLNAACREKARRDPNFDPGNALMVEY